VQIRERLSRYPVLPVVALWAAAALVLSAITGRVKDWYVMTDELLYERYAISVAHGDFPLPHLRGEVSHSFDGLYPLLIAPFFKHGLVPHDLHQAHLANAWIMSSACVPAFLLARRVTGRLWPGYLLGALSLCLPWLVYAPFLITEVAAYPAFLWAMLALQRALSAPSTRNDVVALGGIVLAFFARTQFAALVFVLPVALLAYEAGRAPAGSLRERVTATLQRTVRSHRVLTGAYAVLAVGGVALAAAGRLHAVLGVYGSTLQGSLVPHGTATGFTQHLATLALALGVLPLLVGAGWLLANLVRPPSAELHAFACLGIVALAAIVLEGTIFDLRLGVGNVVFDRYLFYLAPLVLLAFVCALRDVRAPKWSLLVPAALVIVGFATGPLPISHPLNTDTVVAELDDYILRTSGSLGSAQAMLAVATALLLVVFLAASRLARPRHLLVACVLLLAAGLPAETAYTFDRLFSAPGWSGRPLTLQQGGVFDWIDRTVGTGPVVTMIPYATNPGDYFSTAQYWEDTEFWNKSVVRAAYTRPGVYDTPTGHSFAKVYLRIDPRTGAVAGGPTRYAAESDKETRFRIDGAQVSDTRSVLLIDAGSSWHVAWMSFGLSDDGWTLPGVTARVRVFSAPGQHAPVTRTVAFGVQAPPGVTRRRFDLAAGAGAQHGVATNTPGSPANGPTAFAYVEVCVPPGGYGEVKLTAQGKSPVYGDMANHGTFTVPREAGVFLNEIDLADEITQGCSDGSG
jgi:hypothetical protein